MQIYYGVEGGGEGSKIYYGVSERYNNWTRETLSEPGTKEYVPICLIICLAILHSVNLNPFGTVTRELPNPLITLFRLFLSTAASSSADELAA